MQDVVRARAGAELVAELTLSTAAPAPPTQADRDLADSRPTGRRRPLRALRHRGCVPTAGTLELPAGWHVLHRLPAFGVPGVLDHLVVGPAGVFAVDVPHHPDGFIWVRGDRFAATGRVQPHIPNARFRAERAARLLGARALVEVEVTGIVAVAGAERGLLVHAQPHDGAVVVVRYESLATHLTGLPHVLDAASVEAVFGVARHLATWQPASTEWADI